MTKAGGWLPSSSTLHTKNIQDPLLQQIDNIQSFIKQARAAQRVDEVATLEENLRQLQDEYDQQQTKLAIELSRSLAEQESLEEAQPAWGWQEEAEEDTETYMETSKTKISPPSKTQSRMGSRQLPGQEQAPPQSSHWEEEPPAQTVKPSSVSGASLNPFEDDDSSPLAEDRSNPFAVEILKEKAQKDVPNGKKEYNPFDEDEEEEQPPDPGDPGGGLNPFDDEDDEGSETKDRPSAVHAGASTNPFDTPDEDVIEEELLLQQIDNIRAYIFDAKQSGRVDEVELLSENLRELQHTLKEQRRKTH